MNYYSRIFFVFTILHFFIYSQEHYNVVQAKHCVGEEEASIIQQRILKAHTALQKLFAHSLDNNVIPRIALVGSGGGFRSMIAFTACMDTLESLGLLDAILYSATLSGSTWAIGTQLAHAMNITQLKHFLRTQLQHNPEKKRFNSTLIWQQLKRKYSFGRRITFNDIWGSILATMLLENLPAQGQEVYLSTTAHYAQQAHYPFPLFTAVHEGSLEWLEFSPFQIGLLQRKIYIPTGTFGKKFCNGTSTDPNPEETLGYMLGLFGSAYAAHVRDLIQVIINKLQSLWYKQADSEDDIKTITKSIRFSAPQVNNFLYNMSGMPYHNAKRLKLVDAGCAFNLPFPPLFERAIDLYIICDASDHTSHSHEHPLCGVEQYAHTYGYSFPQIPYHDILQNEITLIHDAHNPQSPLLLYIPNKVHFSTLKFTYTVSEFDQIYTSIQNTIQKNKQLFIDAINYAMTHKQLRRSSL